MSCCGTWSGSMCKMHITLQELQVVALMLHKMAFHLSGQVVVLHLDNSTAKANLCNPGDISSLFLPRLTCCILTLARKHGIIVIPAYIPTHFSVDADYLSWENLMPEWHLLPCIT